MRYRPVFGISIWIGGSAVALALRALGVLSPDVAIFLAVMCFVVPVLWSQS